MPRLLFTHSYFYRFDPKQWANRQPYPPYGTIYAAATLRDAGAEVALFDTNLRHSPAELQPVIDRFKPDFLVIYDDGFNYLTKMCLTRMRDAALEMIDMARATGCRVLVSGSDATDHYDLYLNRGAEAVIIGEGEITLREYIAAATTSNTPDYAGISGIVWRDSVGITRRNAARPVVRDLDALPDPAWDLVDLAAYRDVWQSAQGYFSINIATTRGCPYKCNWCAKPIYGNRYNSRSPERVAAEIARLNREHNATHVWFGDDIFGLKPGWVKGFGAALDRHGVRIRYKIQSRADLLLEDNQIEDLARSGLVQAWIGAESGSQSILDAMDKGITVQQIETATRLLRSKGVEVCFFLQFGYLGETWGDIQATINMVKRLQPDDIGISVSYPLPGTAFYDKVRDRLGDKQNWTDSDDLDLMYPSTYPPAFYKRLHRYVHKHFRLHQGLQHFKRFLRGERKGIRWRSVLLMAYYAPALLMDRLRLQFLKKPSI